MKYILQLILAVFVTAGLATADLKPAEVAVVYNESSELSREVMEQYRRVRNIPEENIFALQGVDAKDITRADFDINIRMDLVIQARQRGISWAAGPRAGKKVIRAIVLMPDLPLRVKEDSTQPAGRISGSTPGNSASVDAELMLLGSNFPIAGPLRNPCYKAEPGSLSAKTGVISVTRLDGPDKAAILRMVNDPVKVEQTGLWGWFVVDQGGPYPDGDAWMKAIAKMADERHFPLFHETSKKTLAEAFPLMLDTVAYVGWYANPANGPFRPEAAGGFRFAPGAVAMHLHSFSATSIKDKNRWVGAMLHRGAAVTAGNVAEPTLGGCIDFEVFFRTLMAGHTVAEANLLATPYLSWQNVLLGDPLYRPFPARPARRPAADNPYAKWKELCTRYAKDAKGLQKAVDGLAAGKHGALYAEMLAWRLAEAGDYKQAVVYFKRASELHKDVRDSTRAILLRLTCMPAAGQKEEAIKIALDWKERAAGTTYAPAIAGTADALAPPEKKPAEGKDAKKK